MKQPTLPPVLPTTPRDTAPGAERPSTDAELEEYKLHRRFDRMGRLVGDDKMRRLLDAHVLVVGLGGVGSFAAESLARSGVGTLTIVDFDDVCITNFNRQLHAVDGTVGKNKATVMAERLRAINRRADVRAHPVPYNADTAQTLLAPRPDFVPDFVIDAIDHVTSKCHLLATCRERAIPVVSATGSGGRLDPTQVKVADLAHTTGDPLARALRGILRTRYGFPSAGAPFGIPAVYSTEAHTDPVDLHYDKGQGFRCVCPQGQNEFFTCDARNTIYGNASFVTGTFGLVCASVAVRHLIQQR